MYQHINVEIVPVNTEDLLKDYEVALKGLSDKKDSAQKSQRILTSLIFSYAILGLALIFIFEEKILEKKTFLYTLLLFSVIFALSKIYYFTYFEPFDNFYNDTGSFVFLTNSLPTVLLSYLLIRMLFIKLGHQQPRFAIGLYVFAIFREPRNVIFTLSVLIVGITMGNIIPFY